MAGCLGWLLGDESMTNIWPTLWSMLAAYGVIKLGEGMPVGLQLAIIVGITAGFFYAHNNWEE
jgi:hypothetical protein